jgi:hypothetical protein
VCATVRVYVCMYVDVRSVCAYDLYLFMDTGVYVWTHDGINVHVMCDAHTSKPHGCYVCIYIHTHMPIPANIYILWFLKSLSAGRDRRQFYAFYALGVGMCLHGFCVFYAIYIHA